MCNLAVICGLAFVNAEVVKLVDALRSGRNSCKGVGVRVPPSAFISSKVHWATDSCDCFHDPSVMKLWPT